ncbi:uncharacterized protein C8R40DRAFT_493047 [Lentinula edodes]|uniref:uncharacterized protein n=1 Tax=Lentinula edodes TaxID=5353 RepID=UPI001E8CCF14|nr:uncharacterized protein C8R40DRAFT_493047 [Lentinula edodes]KAH7872273.1 hypothetical protein C8R40DRAFT_493047 [Lentinula edodes]
MPSLHLLARIYRKKTTSLDHDGSGPRVTPEPRASQNENTLPRSSLSSPFERRIHPNLNALAAELSSDIQDTRPPNETSFPPPASPSQIDVNIPFLPLTPWIRTRHSSSSANPTTTQIANTSTRTQEERSEVQEHIPSNRSIDPTTSQSNANPTPSNERPESRTNRIFNRLTGLGARASPTPNPPSAWNTFGRRKSRRHNSIPHASDFGASPDVSLSNSQRSRASSNQTSPCQFLSHILDPNPNPCPFKLHRILSILIPHLPQHLPSALLVLYMVKLRLLLFFRHIQHCALVYSVVRVE